MNQMVMTPELQEALDIMTGLIMQRRTELWDSIYDNVMLARSEYQRATTESIHDSANRGLNVHNETWDINIYAFRKAMNLDK